MSYTKGSMLGGFFDGIGQQDSAEALTEAIIEHVDNAVFRDMYMDTINEALDKGVGYLESYDEEGMAVKEGIDDAIFEMGADLTDMDLTVESHETDAHDPELEYAAEACDEGLKRCIDKLPDGDPADAGTYFSLVNRVNAEEDPEARAAIKEQLDMVSTYIPDTNIVTEDGTAPITNGLRFSNGRDKCPEQYNKPTKSFTNKDGNEIVQAEKLEEGYTLGDEIMQLEDIHAGVGVVSEEVDYDKIAKAASPIYNAGSKLVDNTAKGVDNMKTVYNKAKDMVSSKKETETAGESN